jgi:hypothetical protein
MVGKTITAFSKVPDPYNPAPASTFDKMREKVFFKTGNAIESLSAVLMGYNSFKGANIDGVHKNNPSAGIANIIFMGGYSVRAFAKFGVREVDIAELEAHVAEGLSKVSTDKLPQLVADIVAGLKGDLKDQPIEFGQLYSQILGKVNHYHMAHPAPAEQHSAEGSKALFASNDLKKKSTFLTPPPSTYAEKSLVSPGAAISHS